MNMMNNRDNCDNHDHDYEDDEHDNYDYRDDYWLWWSWQNHLSKVMARRVKMEMLTVKQEVKELKLQEVFLNLTRSL